MKTLDLRTLLEHIPVTFRVSGSGRMEVRRFHKFVTIMDLFGKNPDVGMGTGRNYTLPGAFCSPQFLPRWVVNNQISCLSVCLSLLNHTLFCGCPARPPPKNEPHFTLEAEMDWRQKETLPFYFT